MIADLPGPRDTPLLDLERPDPRRPILLAGSKSSAILSGASEFQLLWEARGAPLEWGGVYGQGVRLTGPWTVRILTPSGETRTLPDTLTRLTAMRSQLESHHSAPEFELVQNVYPLETLPGVGRELRFRGVGPAPVTLWVESEFSPFLAPVLIEGVKPYTYEAETLGSTVRLFAHGAGLSFDADPTPGERFLNRESWDGRKLSGEFGSVVTHTPIRLVPGEASALSWVLWGGLARTVRLTPSLGRTELGARHEWGGRAREAYDLWLSRTPRLSFPDAPQLEAAYGLARSALRALYSAPDPEVTGLVAGYPWYSAVWCRDLAWMLPAVLWMGDGDWVERSLRSVFRYQAPTRIPILAAEAGELPMQLSPGPIFLYGTSDTTLYFPEIVRRLVDQTGNTATAHKLWPSLERIAEWAQAKVHPESGLLRHGGEILQLREASQEVGRVQYGFEAQDTTIWDSTDRRDHALDIQVLWAQALHALGEIASRLERTDPATEYRLASERVVALLGARYPWPEERYLYDSLRLDRTPVKKVRPNALRAVSAGFLPEDVARAAVRRAAEEDLTTPWGLRTLSSRDAAYDPIAYHDGQVWTIATAWAADAALRVGEYDLALRYLATIATRLEDEHGLANECYRGDRPDPFDSCFLLGFSVAPFLTTLFDTLWGLRPALLNRILHVTPRFPPTWRSARLRGLSLGGGRADLDWRPGEVTVRWDGPFALIVVGDVHSVEVAPGQSAALPLRANVPSSG
jgi:hypothetical protein